MDNSISDSPSPQPEQPEEARPHGHRHRGGRRSRFGHRKRRKYFAIAWKIGILLLAGLLPLALMKTCDAVPGITNELHNGQ